MVHPRRFFHINYLNAIKERAHGFCNSYPQPQWLFVPSNPGWHRPRELLRHPGFQEEYCVRPWLRFTDPTDAREEWAEVLDEDISFYTVADEDSCEFRQDRGQWDHCLKK